MPGLVGIVDPAKRTDLAPLLRRMSRSIKHEDWYQTDHYTDQRAGVALGRVHLGIFNPQVQPIENEDRSIAIVMEGEIYDYGAIQKDLAEKGHRLSVDNDPALVLHLYEEAGDRFVEHLNGSFSLAIWDGRQEKVILAGDRYNLRPLYYAELNGRLLFASEVKAILQDPQFSRRVNDVAVAQLFAFGHPVGDETMFEGVKALSPATILTWRNGQLSRRQYWAPTVYEQGQPRSQTEYVSEINRRFRRAVERQIGGRYRIGVPLTGGIDSRLIMAVIDHANVPVFSFTFGVPGATDMLLAPRVAEATNRNHHLYWFQPDFLSTHAEEVISLTDGMLSLAHAHGLPTMRQVRNHAQVLLSGIAGQFCRSGALVTDNLLSARTEDELNLALTKKWCKYHQALPESELEKIFLRSYYGRIKDRAKESLLVEATKVDDRMPRLIKADHFYMITRSRRFNTMGLVFIASQLEHRAPYMDNDVLDVLMGWHFPSPKGPEIQRWFVQHNNPALARIPRERSGIPLDASPLAIKTNVTIEYVSKAINKIAKTSLKRPRFYADYDKWMRDELRTFVEGVLLDPRTLGRGYYNQAHVAELVDRHMRGKANLHEELCALITFELFHRQFLD